MKKRVLVIFLLVLLTFSLPGIALAQTYSFSLEQDTVNVYWNADGTVSIDYVFVFNNDPGASPIDFVDVGLPNSDFEDSSISADVDGVPLSFISRGDYQGSGTGVAIGLENLAIQPGRRGRVHVYIGTVRDMLRPDDQDENYASGVFSPTWFGSKYVHGETNLTVTFHFPPGVAPEEPRWHSPPSGWAPEPQTGFDEEGRITYTWSNARANGFTQYKFGASFPRQYVPAGAVKTVGFLERLGISGEDLFGFSCCLSLGLLSMATIWLSARRASRRKLQYLPPKIAIEGHGIKRGLTAIEAAILMEEPMDKITTMILFAVIKKGAAQVVRRDPLQLKITEPLPEGLHPYETQFLQAFSLSNKRARRAALQKMMVSLVKRVSKKMKGFSHKETVAYYKKIIARAWAQVEAADTPEVKSQKYDEVMEWTMLDRDYDERTRRVFHGGPVFVPIWWPRFDPGYRPATPATVSTPGSGSGQLTLPHLPGSDFAASLVNGVQNVSSNVIGNLTDFTSKVTSKTNPVPVSSSRGRSGGGCACACACAGCACACAGGGR